MCFNEAEKALTASTIQKNICPTEDLGFEFWCLRFHPPIGGSSTSYTSKLLIITKYKLEIAQSTDKANPAGVLPMAERQQKRDEE